MDKTLFLYLDFLGFRQLTKDPSKVRKMFSVLDECNLHKDPNYRAIVFSDTLLAYKTAPGIGRSPHSSELMFLIEFVQDITHRLARSGIFFRALIQHGAFEHKRLDNIDAYFGDALISSYDHEAGLQGTGLFLQSSLVQYDRVFRSKQFSPEYHFSFLTVDLVRATDFREFPLPDEVIQWRGSGIEKRVYLQVEYLRSLWQGCFHDQPSIRSKFLNTWAMYEQNYRELTEVLRASDFSPESLCDIDWESARREFDERTRFWQQE